MQQELREITTQIQTRQAHRWSLKDTIWLFVYPTAPYPTALIGQLTTEIKYLEWIFLPATPSKTITPFVKQLTNLIAKGRKRTQELTGYDPQILCLPLTQEQFTTLISQAIDFQIALADFIGEINYSLPANKFLQNIPQLHLNLVQKISNTPLPGARTVFIDGSGKSHKAGVAWKENEEWKNISSLEPGSTQRAELRAAILALQHFTEEPLNIVSDSQYVVKVLQRIEQAFIKPLTDQHLLTLFLSLQALTDQWNHPIFITHI